MAEARNISVWIAPLALCGLALLAVSPTAPAAPTPGPDLFGYTSILSTDIGGPPFAWSSIGAGDGTGPTCDDGCPVTAPLGFSFDYYGTTYTDAVISDNGFLILGTDSTGADAWSAEPVPTPFCCGPNNMVAAWWADIQPASDPFCNPGAGIFYDTSGPPGSQVFTVEYTNIAYFYAYPPNGGSCVDPLLTFQIKLYEGSNHVDVVYNAVGALSFDCCSQVTVGIEDATGGDGLEHAYADSTSIPDPSGITIRYLPPATIDAVADAASTLEDTPVEVDVLANDVGSGLTVTSAGCGTLGCATVAGPDLAISQDHIHYTPFADAVGTDAVTYTVSDGTSSTTGTVTVTVTPVNDAPLVSLSGDVTVAEDSGATVLPGWASGYAPGPATALDEASQTLSQAVSVPAPSLLSSASVTPGGDLWVTPAADQCTPSPVAADLTVVDSGPGTAPDANSLVAPFLLTVSCVNDAPVALDDAFEVLDNTATLLDVLDNPGGDDYDVDTLTDPSESLDLVAVGTPAYGAAAASGNAVQYTPPAMWTGETGFEYTIGDGDAQDMGWVDVVVGCPSLKAMPDAYATLEDGVLSVGAVDGLLANDVKPGGSLDVLVAVSPLLGTVEVLDDGSFAYVPAANAFGTDTFSYRFKDSGYCNSKGVVTIDVAPVNDDPDAVPDALTVPEDAVAYPLDVLANDGWLPDAPETLSILSATPPGIGTATVTPTAVLFTPPQDWFGTTGFAYTVTDGNGGVGAAEVQVTVLNVDDPPHVHDDHYEVLPGEATTFGGDAGVLGNDVEVDGQAMTAYVQEPPVHGALVLHPSGSFKYTPHPGFTGADAFLYYATDGTMGSQPAVASILVVDNLQPVAAFQASPENVVVGEPIQFTDHSYDLDGEIVSWSWDFGDGSTSSLPQPLHTFLSAGATTVALTVHDEDGGFASATWSPVVTETFLEDVGGAYGAAPPLADAGPDQVVVQGDPVQLDGSGGDGEAAQLWEWTQVGGPTAQLSDGASARPSFTAPALAPDGGPVALTFQLVIFDGHLSSLPDEVQVLVLPTAADTERAQVVAGPDKTVAPGAPVLLEAYTAGFLPGAEVQVQWSQALGPAVGPLPSGPQVSFRAPASGALVFTVTATDGIGDPVSDSLHVVVAEAGPAAGFRYQRGHQPIGLVSFETLVEGVQYRWDFGDGSRIEGPQPVHAYAASGTYMVTHRVTLEDGSVQTFREPVTVFANERASKAGAGGGLPGLLVAGAALALVAVAAVVWMRRRKE